MEEKIKAQYISELQDKLNLNYTLVTCSGGSDGVTLASISDEFNPIWCNSEGELIQKAVYNELKMYCRELINLPDVDSSGLDYAHKYSRKFWKLKTCIIPKYYLEKSNGSYGKDFRDFVDFFKYSEKSSIAKELKKLFNVAVSCDFVKLNSRNQYRISTRNLHYFLNTEGFFCYTPPFVSSAENEETRDIIIKIDGFKVRKPDAKEIRDYCQQYLIRKGTNEDVLEVVQKSNDLRIFDLLDIPAKELDFTDFGADYQIFYFQNQAVRVTADQMEVISITDSKNKKIKTDTFVWEQDILPHKFKKNDQPFFETYYDNNGALRVKILNTDSDFMKFLINGSRIFWEKEYAQLGEKMRSKYILNSELLTEQEQINQEQHFLGKCYAIGYLLHTYKQRGFEKYVYIIDDKVKEYDTENNGRSGKGLLMQGVGEMTSVLGRDAKNLNLLQSSHLLGDYNGQRLIFFDDVHKSFEFSNFYSMITEGLTINPKNKNSYHIPYKSSPKMVGSYNHALRNATNSDLGRILFVSFSDYYHQTSQAHPFPFAPNDDFLIPLFSEQWGDFQWYAFYNFMLQCLQFYLANRQGDFQAPSNNIIISNLKSSIGDSFLEWAEMYFSEDKLNQKISRKAMYDDYMNVIGKTRSKSVQGFRKSLIEYCKLNGYELNPKDLCSSDGKIKQYIYVGQNRTSEECFYIRTPKNQPEKETNQVPF